MHYLAYSGCEDANRLHAIRHTPAETTTTSCKNDLGVVLSIVHSQVAAQKPSVCVPSVLHATTLRGRTALV
jgi:hypothetical protein